MGSALANKSVQAVLDGVCLYLPTPDESLALATNIEKPNDPPQTLSPTSSAPLVSLAFKLEEGRYGQLTYIRVYQGTLKKGGTITNVRTGKKVKVPRLVRMHSDEMEDVDSIGAGEICAMFGVECSSGDTFSDAPGGGGFTMVSSPSITSRLVPLANVHARSLDVDVRSRACYLPRYPTEGSRNSQLLSSAQPFPKGRSHIPCPR